MTTGEYFAIALPTDADFASWTNWLLDRADRANRLFTERHPELMRERRISAEIETDNQY